MKRIVIVTRRESDDGQWFESAWAIDFSADCAAGRIHAGLPRQTPAGEWSVLVEDDGRERGEPVAEHLQPKLRSARGEDAA